MASIVDARTLEPSLSPSPLIVIVLKSLRSPIVRSRSRSLFSLSIPAELESLEEFGNWRGWSRAARAALFYRALTSSTTPYSVLHSNPFL